MGIGQKAKIAQSIAMLKLQMIIRGFLDSMVMSFTIAETKLVLSET